MDELQRSVDLETVTIHILLNEIRRGEVKCYTVLTDPLYLNVFESPLFKLVAGFPSFLAVVEEYEDLLSPNFDTLECLRQARNDGCNFFIIYLANGLQLSRLLMFGDRYREMNMRAKYLILHDFRLFRTEMHYIWKRIVNVIFLRYHKNKQGANNAWFDLSTVPFPSPMQGILVPKRIDTWRNEKFRKNSKLFEDKAADLRGQSLRVVYFDRLPGVSVMKAGNDTKISGLEVNILNTLAKKMNFNPIFYTPESIELHQWGELQSNGTFSGLFGEMVNGKAEIGLANLQYTPNNLHLTDLTIPYMSHCLTFLTPEALSDNSWKTLILPFTPYLWVGVLLILFVTGIIFNLLALSHMKLSEEIKEDHSKRSLHIKSKEATGLYQFGELTNSILYTFGMLLVVSLPKLPSGWSIRVLTGWYWLYCILLTVSYRASMTAILANPAPRVTIDTLEELIDSKIGCGGWGTETKNFFLTSNDDLSCAIGEKFELINDADKAAIRVARGELAYYDNSYYLKSITVKRKNKIVNNVDLNEIENGTATINGTATNKNKIERNLHIMRNCVVHMPISIGLQKNSPLKPKADKYLRSIIEVGLVEKWLSDAMQKVLTSDFTVNESIKAVINLQKLYGAFVALGIGYFLSWVCLGGELLHWHFVVLRDPHYDRHAMDMYYARKNF